MRKHVRAQQKTIAVDLDRQIAVICACAVAAAAIAACCAAAL